MTGAYIVEESPLARRRLEDLVRGAGVEIISSASEFGELEDRFADDDLPSGVIVTSAESAQLAAILEQSVSSDLFNGAPVVVFADAAIPPYDAAAAIRIGARAVLSTELSRGRILAALEAVSQGFVVTAPAANPVRGAAPPPVGSLELVEPLTSRELEVLRLLALGLANKQIAARLNISDHTVKFHVAAILGKLGAASRTEAVAIGMRSGLILI